MKKYLLIAIVILLALLIALAGFVIFVNSRSPVGIAIGIFGFVIVVCSIPLFISRKYNK